MTMQQQAQKKRTAGAKFTKSFVLLAALAMPLAHAQLTVPRQPIAKPLAGYAAAKPAEEERSTAKSTDGSIKVHGHWSIKVVNPDGTVAQDREFENSLQPIGSSMLIGLMSGQLTPGNFYVNLSPSSGGIGPCKLSGTPDTSCTITQSNSTWPAIGECTESACTSSLTVTPAYGTNFAGPFTLTFSGSIAAMQAGSIATVTSVYSACSTSPTITGGVYNNPTLPATVTPASCAANTTVQPYIGVLTQTSMTAIPVTQGQQIQVVVTLSFS